MNRNNNDGLWGFFNNNFFNIFKELRLSYLPPLMVYFAAGVSGFTGIVESFYVKDTLGVSPVFLANLGFWAGLPWAMKVPLGHLVDLYWRWKSMGVYFGALLMGASLAIMIGLTGEPAFMAEFLPLETWYVFSALLGPIGYVFQDVVADAMTVEAVPPNRDDGSPWTDAERQRMHVTVQTMGRVAIVGGGALVAGAGGWLAGILSYVWMYRLAMVIPVISVSGVYLHRLILTRSPVIRMPLPETPIKASRSILGGGAAFFILSLSLGLSGLEYKEETIFIFSLAIILYLMRQLLQSVSSVKRRELCAIAAIIFIYRAMPGFGAGASWWQIDVLGFDESFFGSLRQISAVLVIIGMLGLRAWMARRPVPYLIVFVSIYGTFMALPYIGMYYGLHEWTSRYLGFGARTIAVVDTMADSPLGQLVMIPMLAWIAKEAPMDQKATYFAVMAALTNLALSASQLATKYVNQIYTVVRGNYDELGILMISVTIVSLIVPLLSVRLLAPKPGEGIRLKVNPTFVGE